MAKKPVSKKSSTTRLSDEDAVAEYMAKLTHRLKSEVEAVRKIIKANKKISERVKWNAPSYHCGEDLVTFNLRNEKVVHLVFHHPEIVNIKSALLEGDYKDRRMTYFDSMGAVNKAKKELTRIIDELVTKVNT